MHARMQAVHVHVSPLENEVNWPYTVYMAT